MICVTNYEFECLKNRNYYEHIILDFDTKIRRAFWVKSKYDSRPIAAAVIPIYNNTAYSLHWQKSLYIKLKLLIWADL